MRIGRLVKVAPVKLVIGAPGLQVTLVFQVQRARTVKKLAHTIWACNKNDVTDGVEVLGGSRVAIQRVGD